MHFIKHTIGYLLPIALLAAVWWALAQFHVNGTELIEVTGVTGLLLFGLIFIIGPLPKFWEDLSPWKVFRPYWAKWAVFFIFIHLLLVYTFYANSNVVFLFSRTNPQFLAAWLGLIAFLYFFFMMVISEENIRAALGPWWKRFHTAGYIAFTLAVLHLVLQTRSSSALPFSNGLVRATFVFAVIVIVTRLYVAIWAHFTKPKSSIDSSE